MKKLKRKESNVVSYDPDLYMVLSVLEKFTAKEISQRSYNAVGKSTIYNWRNGKTRRPMHATLSLALKAVGYTFTIERKK